MRVPNPSCPRYALSYNSNRISIYFALRCACLTYYYYLVSGSITFGMEIVSSGLIMRHTLSYEGQ